MTLLLAAESLDAIQGENAMMLFELCGEVLHFAAIVVGAIGVLIIMLGVARGAALFVRSELTGSKPMDRNRLRMDLGYYLLLGLEFLLAADIIETLLAPDFEHIAILGVIVVIRTVISVSLNWELGQNAKHAAAAAE